MTVLYVALAVLGGASLGVVGMAAAAARARTSLDVVVERTAPLLAELAELARAHGAPAAEVAALIGRYDPEGWVSVRAVADWATNPPTQAPSTQRPPAPRARLTLPAGPLAAADGAGDGGAPS